MKQTLRDDAPDRDLDDLVEAGVHTLTSRVSMMLAKLWAIGRDTTLSGV